MDKKKKKTVIRKIGFITLITLVNCHPFAIFSNHYFTLVNLDIFMFSKYHISVNEFCQE